MRVVMLWYHKIHRGCFLRCVYIPMYLQKRQRIYISFLRLFWCFLYLFLLPEPSTSRSALSCKITSSIFAGIGCSCSECVVLLKCNSLRILRKSWMRASLCSKRSSICSSISYNSPTKLRLFIFV